MTFVFVLRIVTFVTMTTQFSLQKGKKNTFLSFVQAPPGLAAALDGFRALPVDLQDQGVKVVQVPRQTCLQDRGPSFNNKPRHQQPDQDSPVPQRPPAFSRKHQTKDKSWGRARPNKARWDQLVGQWDRPGRQVQQEPYLPPW